MPWNNRILQAFLGYPFTICTNKKKCNYCSNCSNRKPHNFRNSNKKYVHSRIFWKCQLFQINWAWFLFHFCQLESIRHYFNYSDKSIIDTSQMPPIWWLNIKNDHTRSVKNHPFSDNTCVNVFVQINLSALHAHCKKFNKAGLKEKCNITDTLENNLSQLIFNQSSKAIRTSGLESARLAKKSDDKHR